jgi:hypothetical protein
MTQEIIDKSINTARLQLKFWQRISHYGVGHGFAALPFAMTYVCIKDYIENQLIERGIIAAVIIGLVGIIVAGIFYYLLFRQLKFTIIRTEHNREDIERAIKKTADELEWIINDRDSKYIIAIQKPSPFFESAHRITIIFNNDKVLINSISVGHVMFSDSNSDNVDKLKNNLMAST